MIKKLCLFVCLGPFIGVCILNPKVSIGKVKTSPTLSSPQELTDLKIAVGAYEDGLYKIAAGYLQTFLKKYPKSKFTTEASLLLANAFLKTRDSKSALLTYRSILNKSRNLNKITLIQIHYSIYEILKKKHLTEAIVHLKFIVDLSLRKKIKNNISYQALLDLATYYKNEGNTTQAEKILDEFLLLSPPGLWREEALLQKTILLTLQNRFDESLSLLKPIIQKTKNLEGRGKEFYLYWAISNLKRKRYCVAQGAYKKLIKPFMDTPTLNSVINGYILSFSKCFADEHVRNEIFLSLYRKFKKRPSILFQIFYLEGLINFQEGKYKKSSAIWIKTLKSFPDHPKLPEILVKLDKIFKKTKDLKAWEALLLEISKGKEYLPETREVDSLLLGNLYFSQKKYETALPLYFNTINKKKYRKFCLERIILCYYYLEKYREAKTNLSILLLENPRLSEKPSILFLEADLLLRSNKTEKALDLFNKLIGEKKQDTGNMSGIWIVKAKLELGKIYFLKKDFETAKKYFMDVLKQVTSNIEDNRIAAFYLGLISEKEKKPELSETYFQIASLSKKMPIRIEALFRLGLAKKTLKSYKESEKIFQDIIKKHQGYTNWQELSRLQLAEIYVISKSYGKAIPQIKYLLEKSKDTDIKKQANKLLKIIKNTKT